MTETSRANGHRRCVGIELKLGAIGCAATLALAASYPSIAHHSFAAEFDSTKEVRATGAVSGVEWMNPHAWIHVQVEELCERPGRRGSGRGGPAPGSEPEAEWMCRSPAADEANWGFELGSPNDLMRRGWTRNSLSEGDAVTINGTRARDGSPNGNARNVESADGARLFAGSSEEEAP
jgi:hypothetical protein